MLWTNAYVAFSKVKLVKGLPPLEILCAVVFYYILSVNETSLIIIQQKQDDMTKKSRVIWFDLCTTARRNHEEASEIKSFLILFACILKNILITHWKMSSLGRQWLAEKTIDFPSCSAPQEGGNSKY